MRWWKDPLVAFLLLGAVIFLLARFFSAEGISFDVVVDESDIKQLNDKWDLQMRRPPTQEELDDLIAQFVKEEIYYRESQRLGLLVNDSIVRQRMVQKLTFLTEDVATARPLDKKALRAYFDANINDYRVAERFSFSHRYFSSDRREDAQTDAGNALGTSERGDPFMLQKKYKQRTEGQIGDLFGREFAEAVSNLEPGKSWQGPFESAYGWHIVKLEEKESSFIPEYSTVSGRVAVEAKQAARRVANDSYYEDLLTRYNVSYPALKKE